MNYTNLEKTVANANIRGLQSKRLASRIFSGAKNRDLNNLEYPEELKQLLPQYNDLSKEKVEGKVVTIGNLICVEHDTIEPIDSNYTIEVNGKNFLAATIYRVLEGVDISIPSKNYSISEYGYVNKNEDMRQKDAKSIILNVGTKMNLLDVTDAITSSRILEGVRGEEVSLNDRRLDKLETSVKNPNDFVSFKKHYPRAAALLALNTGLNLCAEFGQLVIFNGERIVKAKNLEKALEPENIGNVIKRSKDPKVKRNNYPTL